MNNKIITTFSVLLLMLTSVSVSADTFTWNDLRDIALEKNPDIIRSGERLYRARLNYLDSAAGFIPDLSLGASSGTDSEGRDRNTLTLDASYNFSLLRGGNRRYSLLRSRLDYESARLNRESTLREVLFRLRNSFGDILMEKENLAAARETLQRVKRNLEIISLRYEAGREDRGALLRAEADLAREEYNLSIAERRLQRAKENLFSLIGMETPGSFSVEGEFSVDAPPPPPDFRELLLAHPDYLSALNTVKTAELATGERKRSLWPSLTASAGASLWTDEEPFDESSWQASLNLRFPFFSMGRDILSLKGSESEKRVSLVSLEERERNLLIEIRNAYDDILEAKENLKVVELYGEATRERVEILMEKYLNGLISYYEWDSAERELINARNSIITARSRLYTATARWKRVTGGEE